MRWQTRVRTLLGLLVLLLAAGVTWYVVRQRPQAAAPPVSPRTDAKAETEISGDELTRTDENNKVVFRIKYDGGFTYPAESRVRLVKVSGTIMRGTQPIEFRADEADLKLKSGSMLDYAKFDEIHLRGNVLIRSGPGAEVLHLETAEAVYSNLTGVMTTDKPVTVKRGHMSGSGTGATFDSNRNVMWLLANAKVRMDTDQGPVDVTSARAGLAETEKYMRFEEGVRMERDGRTIETDAAIANLTPDGKGITSLELRGKSSVRGGAQGDGGVPNMSADDITITYGAESGLLERTVLMRAARLELPEGGGKSLAGDHIDLGFGGDGRTVTVLDASGAVELKIPADREAPAREVRAPRLEARGAVPKGLERAAFSGGVAFREQAAARGTREAVDRTGRSESLVLNLDGGFNKITNADFAGNVRFTDKDVTGEAPEARYGVDSKRILLRGGSGRARVIQEDGTIDAKEIDLTLDPRRMTAKGNVSSTLKPGARKDRKEPRPSILEDDQPVNITSNALDYDGTADRAVYSGDARLWQGDTVIQAETIILDDKTGNLEARKKMRGTFIIREDPVPGEKPKAPKPTQADADELIYDEAHRRATFRGKARLRGPEGNISAERIEVFLREDGNTLDHVEGYENVAAELEGGRVATGTRLTYDAKSRRYDMQGKPLRVRRQVTDKGAGGAVKCEETVGASLTFERSADSFRVDGADGAPSRTVTVPCTAK